MMPVSIAPFETQDQEQLQDLLRLEALPTEDLNPFMLRDFIVARSAGKLVGAAGLERFGQIGLLRSVVVNKLMRGTGLGKRLVATLEHRARKAGMQQLFLLTTGADTFFATLGYKPLERDKAPEPIKKTAQFSQLCPSSSVFMVKTLGARDV